MSLAVDFFSIAYSPSEVNSAAIVVDEGANCFLHVTCEVATARSPFLLEDSPVSLPAESSHNAYESTFHIIILYERV